MVKHWLAGWKAQFVRHCASDSLAKMQAAQSKRPSELSRCMTTPRLVQMHDML